MPSGMRTSRIILLAHVEYLKTRAALAATGTNLTAARVVGTYMMGAENVLRINNKDVQNMEITFTTFQSSVESVLVLYELSTL